MFSTFKQILENLNSYPQKKVDLVITKSSDNDRRIIEKTNADLIFDFEEKAKKDFIHHRNSGLNQVLCKLLREKDKIVCFNFNTVLKSKGMLRAQLIGRMMQNIRLCRKYNVKTIIASFAEKPYDIRSCPDLKSVFISLRMHPKEAKDSLECIYKQLS